jgi:toxin ParE1/3/4
MAKFNLTNEAKEDILRIHEFGTRMFGSQHADKYLNDFFDCFELIAKQPLAFESIDSLKEGYRRCVCGVDSIFYRIEDNVVEIMAIVGRQNIDRLF